MSHPSAQSTSASGVSPRRQQQRTRPRPRTAYPPPPLLVFNPLWICCLCCPADLTDQISSCIANTCDAAFDGAVDCVASIIGFIFGPLMICLGPIMVMLAMGIIALLSYTFFTIVLPMLAPEGIGSSSGLLHVSIVFCILINVLYNYYMCTFVRNDDCGPKYNQVVKELADATGFRYPETEEEVAVFKLEHNKKLADLVRADRKRIQQEELGTRGEDNSKGVDVNEDQRPQTSLRRRTSGTSNKTNSGDETATKRRASSYRRPTKVPPWMLLGADEWGFCLKSNQPKPPRSHYDHVTKCLILNMDHYCPWTFNAVGFFNYRYFVTFVLHVFFGMIYSLYIAYTPFCNRNGTLYERQIHLSRAAGHATTQHMIPFVPTPEERLTLSVAYVFVILTFLGVGYLFGFHMYLVLTAQTTIEQRGNSARKQNAERLGKKWTNPYSLGWRKNWQFVFGSRHPLLAILPSPREPEFLPLPVNGKLVRRGRLKGSKVEYNVV